MMTDYFLTLAAAFVRGKLIHNLAGSQANPPLFTKALDELSDDEIEMLIQLGKEHELRLHRFKKSMKLPRVHKVLGVLKGIQPQNQLDIGSGRGVFLWPLLDALRKKLKIAAEDDQGPVVAAAKEQAREWMRKKQSFIWNATNVTRMMRQQLIELFLSYNARVRIVYLDAPFNTILQRNRNRQNSIPEQVIYKLLSKLEVPTLTEAHQVDWIHEP